MAETDNNKQGQKPKTSKLAVASLFVPLAMWAIGFLGSACGWFLWVSFYKKAPPIVRALCGSGPLLVYVSMPTAVILGIAALRRIRNSSGMLKGKRFAIEGILVSISLEVFYIAFCIHARDVTLLCS